MKAFVAASMLALSFAAAPALAVENIQGTVAVSPALAKQVTPNSVLYVIARDEAQQGPPVAVVRINNPKFPQSFAMGPNDMMQPGTPFKGPYRLTAKLSKSGNAITSPGDLLSTPANAKPLAAGTKGATLTLDKQAQ